MQRRVAGRGWCAPSSALRIVRPLTPALDATSSMERCRSRRNVRSADDDLPQMNTLETIPDASQSMAAQTRPISPPFVPRPGSAEFGSLLAQLEFAAAIPMVGVGRRYGPRMPQLRTRADDAPEDLRLDQDMERVALARHYFAQPWYPDVATAENREDRQEKVRRWKRPERWQPLKRPSTCMSVAAARHLSLWDDEKIGGALLELAGSGPRWHSSERRTFRSVQRMVEKGDDIWTSLGAWPWVAFDDGHPPEQWWTLADPLAALQQAVDARIDTMRTKLARADELSGWLHGRAAV